jgi:hypothetical protein
VLLCSFYLILILLINLIFLLPTLILPGLGVIFFFILYFKTGQQIISFIQAGLVSNNFVWSLPNFINNLLGFSIQGTLVDLAFWSGLVLSAVIIVSQLERIILLFLAKRKVGFALKIVEEEKAKLMAKKQKKLEIQAQTKPISAKQKIIIAIVSILLVGLICASPFLYEKWQNRNYPVIWKKIVPGTAIWLDDCAKCGKKGTVLENNIKTGEPRIESFSLQEQNKEMILDIKLIAQPRIKPEFSLEVELKNPDNKTILYIGKDELFSAIRPETSTSFQKRFYFTTGKAGNYTLKITPYSYGISSIQALVRDIVKK